MLLLRRGLVALHFYVIVFMPVSGVNNVIDPLETEALKTSLVFGEAPSDFRIVPSINLADETLGSQSLLTQYMSSTGVRTACK
jgi:hypothetical protein